MFSLRFLILILVVPVLSGCGSSPEPLKADDTERIRLELVGQILRDYQLTTGKAPKSINDLQHASGSAPGGFEPIKSGDIIVNWNVLLPDTKEEPGGSSAEQILAYPKKVTETGGPVLLLNRLIRTVTPDEFKTIPQATASKP